MLRLTRLELALAAMAASGLGFTSDAELPSVRTKLRDGTAVELAFAAVPPLGDCRRLSSSAGVDRWECSGYNLEIAVTAEGAGDLISFDLESGDGTAFDLVAYGAKVSVPSTPGDGLWSYNERPLDGLVRDDLARAIRLETSANRGIPFLVLVDPRGDNRLALGLVAQDRMAALEAAPSAEGSSYALETRVLERERGKRFRGSFYASRAPRSWFRVAQAYTETVDRTLGTVPREIPDAAFDPTYDSWYWTSDRIDQELVWDLAVRSRRLGFKSYLIDAGWDVPAGEYGKGLDGSTGDYAPPADAFPDFTGLLGRIRGELGMRVVLWMQQYALGRGSVYFPEMNESLSRAFDPETGDLGETLSLCPRSEAARLHMAGIVGRVMDDFKPDGLWLDWQENIPIECQSPHAHDPELFGAGYNAAQAGVLDAVASRSPSAVVEVRWPFANLNNKPHAHLWQPIDTPDNFEVMRLQALAMRPFSAGVVIGTDEMYWRPEVSDREAARFMAAVVFSGVPYFGPNLLEEPEARREMLKAWLAFYEAHRRDLTTGSFAPYGDRGHPDQIIENERAAFIYYGNRYTGALALGAGAETIHIVNASAQAGIDLRLTGVKSGDYRAEVSDLVLRYRRLPQDSYLGASARLQFDVPVGCILRLTRIP